MSVNRDYWSGSETKTVYGVDVELPLFPVNSATVRTYPYFANSFVAKTKDNGVDWKQPIDTSYSFCRTDNNYCGCKSVVVCGYATSYNPAAQRSRKYDINIDSFDVGLGIKSGVSSTADSYIQYTASSASTLKCTTIPNTNTENKKPDTLAYNSETFYKFNKNFAPILKVNPRDYMLVIMVNCAKLKDDKTLADFATDGSSIFNGTAMCDLKTYLLKYYEEGYTIITGVWCFVVANPTAPTNIGSNIAPVLYSTNTINIDYTGSDGDAYTFSANLPSMFNIFGGTSFRYTPDDERTIGLSFSLQDALRFGEIIIAGTLNGGNSYITYPYQFGPVHVGDYFKIYENANKTYLLTAATVDDFGGLDTFREWCRKQTAYFGLPFRENRDFTNVNEALTDERIMWGIIDSSGVTHGEYTIGIGNLTNPLYNSNNLQDDSGWKPGGGGGGDRPKPDPDKNPILPGTPGFSLATASGSKSYVITSSEFEEIWNDVYIRESGAWKDIMEGLELFGSNPLNAILTYRWYPFTLGGSSTYPVILGRTIINENHTYTFISNDNDAFYKSSGNFWYGYDKNFINSKHCKCRIFLPFYGFAELPMSQVLSKELEIDFQYNIPDDLGVWIISFGNVVYDYYECSPYIDIPITGDNSTQIAIAKRNQAINTALTVAGVAATIATAGVAGIGALKTANNMSWLNKLSPALEYSASEIGKYAVQGASLVGSTAASVAGAGATIAQAQTNTANTVGNLSTNIPTKAGASATTFLHLPMYPYIQFYTNTLMDSANISEYKKTVGIACEKWSTIGNMPDNSLLAISNPVFDTSGMNENEINMLTSALSSFYK